MVLINIVKIPKKMLENSDREVAFYALK